LCPPLTQTHLIILYLIFLKLQELIEGEFRVKTRSFLRIPKIDSFRKKIQFIISFVTNSLFVELIKEW
jgi:hypothetical protein